MNIKYPVRVSLTDETLIIDRDNVEVATTFFDKEDYDAEYKRRSADAVFITECLNERASITARIKAMEEALTPSAETKAAYIGEFNFDIDDVDGDGFDCTRNVTVPWDTVKEIMAAILRRSALAKKEG